ncbi:DNA-binding MarR family transcriptional regulator [Natranaerovirga pectinivora]|uniref:DNA-binding MarR family transcriptional regulator n=1 Tax=Natranaerovirga pectinivora TaxID=682400 RepID=A0A4R3MP86_9FIRM|nr:MarR family transcriptional regulator [Natranaerovirga pectinivora]TCT15409.1 DNA-binding MarR family transcriptional regulator [Natranaerovirga pectinivora]
MSEEKCNVSIGYLLNKAARMTRYHLEGQLTEIGLTVQQFAVIRDIDRYNKCEEKEEYLTPALIAKRLGFNRPTITGVLERLETSGWITRETNPKDRRSQFIILTDKAGEKLPLLETCSKTTMNDTLKGLSENEISDLSRYLNIIIKNIEKN